TVDDATARMLEGRFAIEEAGGVRLLRGELASREGSPRLLGKPTPHVGRARELSILETLFSSCVEESTPSAVLVTGPAGSGKSRLGREFLAWVRQRGEPVEILCGYGDSLGTGSPFGIVADALRRAAGLGANDPMEARRTKLAARVGRH